MASPPPLMTKKKPAPKRSAPQTKPLAHQLAKKKASSNPVIPQKLSFEKSEKELKAAVKKDVDSFFKKVKKQREVRENPGETVLLPTSRSSKKEGGPEKAGISKDPAKIGLRPLSHQVI